MVNLEMLPEDQKIFSMQELKSNMWRLMLQMA